MSNKNKLFIILGVIVIVLISFIIGLFTGQRNALKTDIQIAENANSIPLQIEISEGIGTKSETEIKKYTLNKEEIYVLLNIIDNLIFSEETCDGIPTHNIRFNSDEKNGVISYSLEIGTTEHHILFGLGEAIVTGEQKEQLDTIINKLYI